MKAQRILILTLVTAVAVAALAVAGAVATPPSGLTSQLLARGGADHLRISDKSLGLKIRAAKPTDLAIVQATLAAPTAATPGGFTGWHGHPGPSLVVVKSGTLTMQKLVQRRDEDDRSRRVCVAQTFRPGQAFVHPKSVHNFVNTGGDAVEFYVVYFVRTGAAPLLHDKPVPPECS